MSKYATFDDLPKNESGGVDFDFLENEFLMSLGNPDPSDEDTSQLDRDLIARELEKTARLAGNLNQPELATEIGAIVAKIRKPPESEGNGPQA